MTIPLARLGAVALVAFTLSGCIIIPSGHRHYRPYAVGVQPVYVPPPPVRVIQRYERLDKYHDRYQDNYDPDPAGPRRGWR